eukprot:NODE_4_length_55019_cov_0.425091.p35 type:complete len:139 gc:universal NODE_4_length_55019_cov_0.425091:43555-43139(-)
MSNMLNGYFKKGIVKNEEPSQEKVPSTVSVPLIPIKKPRKFDGIATDVDDFDPSHFRIYVGNLGDEVTDVMLLDCFQEFKSFQKAKVVKDYKTGRSKGYGFVSFKDGPDFLKALKEKNNTFLGRRPMKIKKSKWKSKK